MSMPAPPGAEFEESVRSVARARWLLPPGGGGAERIAGHDIDVVCRTEEIVHLIMVTTLRTLAKVSGDCSKLAAAKLAEGRRNQLVKCWMVTFFEPTHDQKSAATDMGAHILSLDQFRASLVDANVYLNARADYKFGSATNPDTETMAVPDSEYVPLPLSDQSGRSWAVDEVVEALLAGTTVTLSGPFGAGKSLTVREVFFELRQRHLQGRCQQLPLPLNLRDHWGQDDVSEVLIRHARNVGYSPEHQIVRAWNAGQFVALLDGFDELASRSWRIGPEAMKATRRESLAIVRRFVEQRAQATGVLISGRSHYFDSKAEMRSALGLSFGQSVNLTVGEFTDDQALAFLNRGRATHVRLPDWLPRKPLLLSYLASRGLLEEVLAIPDGLGAAHAWDQFLDRIAAREAQITQDIDGTGVRHLLEILATKSRAGGSRGQLFETDLIGAYSKAAGVEPSEDAKVLLQRLPGLTTRDDSEAGARTFVDGEMLDALRGSSSAAFIRSPYEDIVAGRAWGEPLGSLGVSVAGLLLDRWGIAESQAAVAAREALDRWNEPTLALDVLASGAVLASSRDSALDMAGLRVTEGLLDVLDLESTPVSRVSLHSCLVNELVLGEDEPVSVSLEDCTIGRVVGVGEARWLPDWVKRCDVDSFDSTDTNSAIMNMETIPLPVRTLLTVLRKLFVQRGAGRKEAALFRGLSQQAQELVGPVLELLESNGLVTVSAHSGDRVWHADRSQQGRVLAVLAEKDRSSDPLVRDARRLG